MTELRVGAATDRGLVRRINQDQMLVADDLWAVADGMGGHAGGEVASLTAVEALRAAFSADGDRPRVVGDLEDAVRRANEAVFERSQSREELRGMGTTLTAAALVRADGEDRLAIANVGDSRAYVLNRGDLTQMTEDHSVPEELVRQGQLDPEEAATHPQRHVLTRALGVFPEVDVDMWELVPFAGDRVVLCSDGLCRELNDDQIASVLRRLGDPQEAARELVQQARANGGADNITVVVVDVVDDGGRAEAASKALADEPGMPTTAIASGGPAGEDDDEAGRASRASAGAPASSGPQTSPAPARHRRLTVRTVAFLFALLVIISGALAAIGFYARGSYFVGVAPRLASPPGSAAPIVIYRGRPGGLLWFKPTLAQRTRVTSADVLPARIPDLVHGKVEATLADARAYVANLTQEAAAARRVAAGLPALPPPGPRGP